MRGRLLTREGDSARQHKHSLRRSRKQEASVAQDFSGARVMPGSGNTWHSKGDVKSPRYLVECKTTENKSYSIKAEELSKLVLQAVLARRIPVMQVELGNGSKWAVIEWDLFLEKYGDESASNESAQCDVQDGGNSPRAQRRSEAPGVPKRGLRLRKSKGAGGRDGETDRGSEGGG